MLEEELDKYVHHSYQKMVARSRKKTRTSWKFLCSWCIIEMHLIFYVLDVLLKCIFNFGGHHSFLWVHWYNCFKILVMSTLSSKPGWNILLECIIVCSQWIPQIHLWFDTCWPHGSQHGGWVISLHTYKYWWDWSPGSSTTLLRVPHSVWQYRRFLEWNIFTFLIILICKKCETAM